MAHHNQPRAGQAGPQPGVPGAKGGTGGVPGGGAPGGVAREGTGGVPSKHKAELSSMVKSLKRKVASY